MTFVWPVFLFCLLLIPVVLALYAWMQTRRRRYVLRYSSTSLVTAAVGTSGRVRRHAPAALYSLAIAAMIVSLSRPQMTIRLPEATGTVILAIDASRSMLTTDVTPSRIEAAKAAVREFAAKQPEGIKIGIVAFAGSASLVTPPTGDRKQVVATVNTLSLGTGTNIGDGLRVSLEALTGVRDPEAPPGQDSRSSTTRPAQPTRGSGLIVLLSDGAATTGPRPLDVADELGQAGIRTYTVGIGTRRAGLIGGGPRELDETTLKGIADRTGGHYYSVEDAKQLHDVYSRIARHHELVERHTEVTFIAAAAAAVFLTAAGVFSLLWSNRLP
jgi:Ca-activated chloride channel homolog